MKRQRSMLVTGAGRGIGAAVARAAAAKGFAVAINYSGGSAASEAAARQLADELGNGCWAVRADVGEADQVAAMFAMIDERWAMLDCLVNNAGIAGSYGTLEGVDAEMLTRLWAVNVTGAFLCARESAARMPAADQGGGVIVNVSSKAAVLGGAGEWVHYAASKGALETMTSGLARELAVRNIRVNAVRPGLVDNNFGPAPADRIERLRTAIPMQRVGQLSEVADAIVWLAADAPSYVTGTFIDVTGGR